MNKYDNWLERPYQIDENIEQKMEDIENYNDMEFENYYENLTQIT